MVMMRQLIGPYAGELVDMPFAVAENCRAAGTACRPDDIPSVKGLKITPAPALQRAPFPQMIKKGSYRLSDGSVFKGNKWTAAETQAALEGDDAPPVDLS